MVISRCNGIKMGVLFFMNKQQEKVFNETRIRNLKRRCVQCMDKGEIEEAIDIKLEIDQLQKRI